MSYSQARVGAPPRFLGRDTLRGREGASDLANALVPGFANATNGSTPATDAATLQLITDANELMAEIWGP